VHTVQLFYIGQIYDVSCSLMNGFIILHVYIYIFLCRCLCSIGVANLKIIYMFITGVL